MIENKVYFRDKDEDVNFESDNGGKRQFEPRWRLL